MSDVKLLLVGDTNVGRPDPDSAFCLSVTSPSRCRYPVL